MTCALRYARAAPALAMSYISVVLTILYGYFIFSEVILPSRSGSPTGVIDAITLSERLQQHSWYPCCKHASRQCCGLFQINLRRSVGSVCCLPV